MFDSSTTKIPSNENYFLKISRKLNSEIRILTNLIKQYQTAMTPFLTETEQTLSHLIQKVYGLGSTRVVGSVANRLFTPWSDMNIHIDCNQLISSRSPNTMNDSKGKLYFYKNYY